MALVLNTLTPHGNSDTHHLLEFFVLLSKGDREVYRRLTMFTENINCPVANVERQFQQQQFVIAEARCRVIQHRGSGGSAGPILSVTKAKPCLTTIRKPPLRKMWGLTMDIYWATTKVFPNSVFHCAKSIIDSFLNQLDFFPSNKLNHIL